MKTDDDYIHYYTRSRIGTSVTLIITCFILVLLVLPVCLLYNLLLHGLITTSPETVVVLVVFTLFFSAALAFFTKAKRHEILAASAG